MGSAREQAYDLMNSKTTHNHNEHTDHSDEKIYDHSCYAAPVVGLKPGPGVLCEKDDG
jgi:hypothetical protein